ncbi:hypothetical protein Pcinc_026059 [Petrolisthes cinctipes]|uniref:Uncharacterized protein n=1 Tax=Petrolisthes cinctipes TaxID=88211 RepID=A0AAE1K8K8_PETCI|nr:hypothetical protein Pcinc_026059 [Petrolisthes cinctipes]
MVRQKRRGRGKGRRKIVPGEQPDAGEREHESGVYVVLVVAKHCLTLLGPPCLTHTHTSPSTKHIFHTLQFTLVIPYHHTVPSILTLPPFPFHSAPSILSLQSSPFHLAPFTLTLPPCPIHPAPSTLLLPPFPFHLSPSTFPLSTLFLQSCPFNPVHLHTTVIYLSHGQPCPSFIPFVLSFTKPSFAQALISPCLQHHSPLTRLSFYYYNLPDPIPHSHPLPDTSPPPKPCLHSHPNQDLHFDTYYTFTSTPTFTPPPTPNLNTASTPTLNIAFSPSLNPSFTLTFTPPSLLLPTPANLR